MSNRIPFDNPSEEMTQQDVPERTEPDVEILVAYLDGELDVQSVRQMEDRLAIDPDLREKMASLEQTWNMLNELETVSVDKELVRSTMEVVTLTIEKELSDDEQRVEKRKWFDRLILLATIFMFGVIGYQLATLVGIQGKKQFAQDIPIILNISKYKEIDSFVFLRALSEKRVFDEPTEVDSSPELLLPFEEMQP